MVIYLVRLVFLVLIAYIDILLFNGIEPLDNACILYHDEIELELYHGYDVEFAYYVIINVVFGLHGSTLLLMPR